MDCEDCQAVGAQSGIDNMDTVGDAQNSGEYSAHGDCTGSEGGESWSSPDGRAFEDLLRGESDTVCMCTPYCRCYRKLSNGESPCTRALVIMDPSQCKITIMFAGFANYDNEIGARYHLLITAM